MRLELFWIAKTCADWKNKDLRIRVIQQFLLNELLWFSTWKLDHIKWRHFPRIWYANWINQKFVLWSNLRFILTFLAASSSRTPVKTSRIQQSLQGTPNETKIRQLEAKLAGIYTLKQLYLNMRPTSHTYLDTVVIIMHVTIGCHIERRLRVSFKFHISFIMPFRS